MARKTFPVEIRGTGHPDFQGPVELVKAIPIDVQSQPWITYSDFITAQVAVGVVRVQLYAGVFAPKMGLLVKGDDNNDGSIFVGDLNVTIANGYRLTYSQTVTIEIDDASLIWAVASGPGQLVHLLGV